MSAGFGYSAGDFVATIQLISRVIAAFKDSGGACEEYRQLHSELETLSGLLSRFTNNNCTHVHAIQLVAESCRGPLQDFLDKTSRRYGSSLDGTRESNRTQKRRGGATAKIVAVARKVQWAVFMEKDIVRLRGMIQANLANIDLLLGTSQLEVAMSVQKQGEEYQRDFKHFEGRLFEHLDGRLLEMQKQQERNHLLLTMQQQRILDSLDVVIKIVNMIFSGIMIGLGLRLDERN